MRRLEGKAVLVTGAASGIGRATALRLAEEGARVLCTDVQSEAVEDTAKEARQAGGDVVARVSDVSDPGDVKDTVAEALSLFGRLDALCNIAGIIRYGHTHEQDLDEWNRILAVNLTGTFLMCREAIPHLLDSKGSIVNMASTSSLAGGPWIGAYAASKGGVLAFTYTLAVEYGKQGMRANAICPGSIDTPMKDAFELPEGADAKLLYRMMPLDQFRGPETVASVVAFLISEDAAHVNGERIRVDGATLA
ncbi:MAG: SDR family NAD(P)-dependent oxidoreductase [Proteobacteria bacterium]|nr:SDR family NAD(P)-dependent oxidoreductase [Pseudomonadota bacterium]